MLPTWKDIDLEKLFPWDVIALECNKSYFGPRVFEAQVGFLLRIPLKKYGNKYGLYT